ncbi:MAG TPA: hypothetical protein VFW38_03365 [Solirubrobacteraceae bacterium]|nr:hypothetical protein [Solirubrobacteraceae bacterium]
MSTGALARYSAIERFAQLELELAGAATVEQVQAHQRGWDELTADLPATPPPAALPMLQRAGLLRERARIELLRRREAALAELADVAERSRLAGGYLRASARGPRIERSA